MISRLILASIAVAAVAGRPNSRASAALALAVGGISAVLLGGGALRAAAMATAPMLIFLTAALTLAALAERAGVAETASGALARAGGGRTLRLYALVCGCSTILTCAVSLDGAVVLMVPLVRGLTRRCGLAFTPFFLGAVAVANAASVAVPEGNPTNLVVMSRLGLSPSAFLGHLLVPGLCAAVLCALVPVRMLGPRRYTIRRVGHKRGAERVLLVPWRLGAQIMGLLAALDGLAPPIPFRGGGIVALLAVAASTAAASALVNNLPVSASVAALATAGPGAYAAMVGLSVGGVATPHGSVATMIARDLAGDDGEHAWPRVWAAAAAGAVLCSTFLLWMTL